MATDIMIYISLMTCYSERLGCIVPCIVECQLRLHVDVSASDPISSEDASGWTMPMGRPRASYVRHIEFCLLDDMAEYLGKVAMLCSGVRPRTRPDLVRSCLVGFRTSHGD